MEIIYRVSKNGEGKYQVKKDGSKRALKVFDSKNEAIEFAQKTAKNQGGKVIDDTTVVKMIEKEANKKAKKVKNKAKNILLSILALIILSIAGYFGIDLVQNPPQKGPSNSVTVEGVTYENLQFHFLELGNEYTGDSTYIKAGDLDILIDAGSRSSSAEDIIKYIDKYCTDGKLEYVISTHAHQDHIAGMVGNTKTQEGNTPKNRDGNDVDRTGIYYYYRIGTIIDFALTDSTSKLYSNYQIARQYAMDRGAVHYTAANCFNNEGDAKRSFQLTQEISLNIVYNYYYFNSSGDENNYSVCTLFTYKNSESEHNFLLTGDLEKEGEEEIAKYYDGSTKEKTLPHCDLFKAGHHGSVSSSNECLLSIITPDICTVCCCAGSVEYTANYNNVFPTQEFINRIAKYTDKVYVTSYYDEKNKKFASLNGTIIVSSNGIDVAVAASNNLTKLKDSNWFNEKIYVKDNGKGSFYVSSGAGDENFYNQDTPGAVEKTRRVWPSK